MVPVSLHVPQTSFWPNFTDYVYTPPTHRMSIPTYRSIWALFQPLSDELWLSLGCFIVVGSALIAAIATLTPEEHEDQDRTHKRRPHHAWEHLVELHKKTSTGSSTM